MYISFISEHVFDLSPTSDLFLKHVYVFLGRSDLSWPIWYVISMSAALTVLWNQPHMKDVLGGGKRTLPY